MSHALKLLFFLFALEFSLSICAAPIVDLEVGAIAEGNPLTFSLSYDADPIYNNIGNAFSDSRQVSVNVDYRGVNYTASSLVFRVFDNLRQFHPDGYVEVDGIFTQANFLTSPIALPSGNNIRAFLFFLFDAVRETEGSPSTLVDNTRPLASELLSFTIGTLPALSGDDLDDPPGSIALIYNTFETGFASFYVPVISASVDGRPLVGHVPAPATYATLGIGLLVLSLIRKA